MNVGNAVTFERLTLLATVLASTLSTAAPAITPSDVAATCGRCHGLTVNGIVVAAGPGALGFTATVSGRDQVTWVNTIMRMVGHGATVADVDGTAAYLADLGTQPPTPTAAPTPTGTPGERPPHRPRLPRRPGVPHQPGHAGSALLHGHPSTPTPTPTAMPGSVLGTDPGGTAYDTHCALCHEAGSPMFVGQTIYAAQATDITEALAEVPQMQFLRALLDRNTIQAIASYLRSVNPGGLGGPVEGGDD